MGVCYCSLLCCTLLYVHFSFEINLMGKRELVALLSVSRGGCVALLAVSWGCLRFVIVVFPYHAHLLILRAI